jgi:hypothetical protein
VTGPGHRESEVSRSPCGAVGSCEAEKSASMPPPLSSAYRHVLRRRFPVVCNALSGPRTLPVNVPVACSARTDHLLQRRQVTQGKGIADPPSLGR